MGGWPVWLASVSRRRDGQIVPTGDWKHRFDWAYRKFRMLLNGVGDERYERMFRMNVTLCIQRAMTRDEVAAMPASWHADLFGMAGGPVELVWEKGITVCDSCKPCENPAKSTDAYPERPDLWIPIDCGRCRPCRARMFIAQGTDTRLPAVVGSTILPDGWEQLVA